MLLCTLREGRKYCKHPMLLAMLTDPTFKPPAEDDIRVINQRKSSKTRRELKRQHVGDEEDDRDAVVRKKPKDLSSLCSVHTGLRIQRKWYLRKNQQRSRARRHLFQKVQKKRKTQSSTAG